MMHGPPTSHLLPGSGNKNKMPSDKSNQHHNNSPLASRPLMPKLSAPPKTGRPPLTPRIAGSTTSSRSPILRRPGGGPSATDSPKPTSTPKDGISTPVQAFLSSNITPRSSSRKSRVDSAGNTPNGTPTGTPNSSRPASTFDISSLSLGEDSASEAGLGIDGLADGNGPGARGVTAENQRSFHSPLSNNHWSHFSDAQGSSQPAPVEPSPMFFFASEAKATPPTTRPAPPAKSSSFFYANDRPALSPSGTSTVASPSSTVDDSHPKFFQIKSASIPPQASAVSHGPGSASKRPALAHRPPTYTVASPSWQQPQSHLNRSPSPSRDSPTSSFPAPKLAPLAASSSRTFRPITSPTSHTRTPSTDSITSRPSTAIREPSNYTSVTTPMPTAPTATENNRKVSHKRSISMVSQEASDPSTPTSPTPVISPGVAAPAPYPTSPLSPSKVAPSSNSHADPAAAARRERKVLDLEISNSSLLAINRTLEREMRKQNAELRRFRRLSRSGRLSLARHSAVTDVSVSDISDITSEEDDDDDDEGYGEDEGQGGEESRLVKDENRLKLDLRKHQELLVDSQKMNQSLKRCLGWTEELVKEGKRALEYTVRVSEVEVGGRVLVGDEEGEDDGASEDKEEEEGTGVETATWDEVPYAGGAAEEDRAAPEWTADDDDDEMDIAGQQEMSEEGGGGDVDALVA